MKKERLSIPNVHYLSQWPGLDGALRQFGKKIIVNKIVCGCGMTNYYLTDCTIPVILASPRRELITSKTKDSLTGHAYYFDRSDPAIDLNISRNRMQDYIRNGVRDVPKIMCTYDSLGEVVDCLTRWNLIDRFTIVGDEMTCIFTDAPMKGAKSMEIVNLFGRLPNRCIFITATPLNEVYLDEVPVFKDMTYVSFDWAPERLLYVHPIIQQMGSTRQTVRDIINDYRQDGYFQKKMNAPYPSTEAVFYLNSMTDILKIIADNKLTPDDTRVICADNYENAKNLRRIGFEIGHFPGKDEYKTENRTFTFATRCSFEGADLYSDCACVYIFSDSNRDNLSLDISIDLVQIIGRCRTFSNPYRDEIRYYYKCKDAEDIDLNEATNTINHKMDVSYKLFQYYQNVSDPDVLDIVEDAQTGKRPYGKNYLTVFEDVGGERKVGINHLVRLAELRAIDIKKQYRSRNTLLALLKDNRIVARELYDGLDPMFAQFLNEIDKAPTYNDKIRIYTSGCLSSQQLRQWAEACPDIPSRYKEYYNVLGPEVIRNLNYDRKKLDSELDFLNAKERIAAELRKSILIGKEYTNRLLKAILQSAYQKNGLAKTGFAKQITMFFPKSYPTKVVIDGKENNGYRIYE